jgi:hypothetical protein
MFVNDIGGKLSLQKVTVPIPTTLTPLSSPREISILTSVSLRSEKCSRTQVTWLEALLSIYQILGIVSTEVQHMRKAHSLKLCLKICLLCCSCGTTLLLLPIQTLSNIVPELLTNKALDFAHISPLTTALTTVVLSSSTPLWWGPVDRLSNTGGQLMCHEEMHHQMPCCQRLLVLQGSVWPQHFIL